MDGLRRHVEGLEHRQWLLRSRCASADAAARLAALDGAPSLDLDDTFERWEIRITESEVTADAGSDADGFAAAFDADDEETALKRPRSAPSSPSSSATATRPRSKTRRPTMRADLTTDDLTLDWPEDFADRPREHAGGGTGAGRAIGAADGRHSEPGSDAATPPATRLPLSALLRGLGALVVVGAFVLYLFQGWRGGDDLTRTLLLLGHTVALTLAGFALGHWLREPRGARPFIALALAAMPVSFAFLGGLLYNHVGTVMPDPAAAGFWRSAPDGALALGPVLLLTVAASAVLWLAIGIGFLVLARRSAWRLTALYLLANLALLVPVREGLGVPVLVLGLALLLAIGAAQLRRADASLATAEGLFARLVLALPLLLMAGRSLWLYAPDALLFAVLALLGYGALRLAIDAGARWPQALETAAAGMATLAAGCVLLALSPVHGLADAAKLPIAALVLAGLLLDLGNPLHRRHLDGAGAARQR